MKKFKNNKKGFTLVELLAVIVILAIILVIAVPKVMSVIEDSKKATLESTAKMIASSAEKAKVQNTVLGKDETITCDSVAKINNLDYASCSIDFEDNTAKVTIKGSGKFNGLYVCAGDKIIATATNESCGLRILTVNPDNGTEPYSKKYEAGSTVMLEVPIKEGYTFIEWVVVAGSDASVNGNLLIMGKDATEIKAMWREKITYISDYIEGLLTNETVLNNGLVKDDTVDKNIRYAGSTENVKNKVYFNCNDVYTSDSKTIKYGDEDYDYANNCEIWRIIGVFNTKSSDTDTTGEKRVKIVRDEILDVSEKWDKASDGINYVNQWGPSTLTSDDTTIYPGANLMQYLNGESTGKYYYGLSSIAKGQVGDALWYTGAVTDGTAEAVYEMERSNSAPEGDNEVNYKTTWVGKIGLIYLSDFGYAGTNCGEYTLLNYGDENSCGKTSNWLTSSKNIYWTITPQFEYNFMAWGIYLQGYSMAGDVGWAAYKIRPATYLKYDVKIKGGNGGDEPFKLSI